MGRNNSVRTLYKDMPVQVKASLWFFICSLLQKAISVVSTMLFTRVLSTEDYGIISIYQSWTDIFYILATLNLATGVYNVGMTKYEEERDSFHSSLQILSLGWTIGFSCVFFLLYPYIACIIQLPFSMIIIMFGTFCVMPAFNLWSAKQRYESKYKALIVVTVSNALLIFLISYVAVVNSDDKSMAKILSNAAVTFIFGGVLFVKNLIFKGRKVKLEFIKFTITFNVPMIPAFLAMVVLNQIDRIMISNQAGMGEAGVYSVAYSAAMFISILTSAISATYNPWLIQKIHKKEFLEVDVISRLICVFFCSGLLFFVILAPELIKIIASSEYYEAVYIIPPVAASTFFNLLYAFYCPFAQYFFKMKFLVFVNVGVACLNIVLNYFGIQLFGYLAAGYTTFLCYLLYGWGTVFYVCRLIRETYGKKYIYNQRFFAILTILMSATMVLINYLYKGYVIRYMLVVALIVTLWLKRSELRGLMNCLRG